MKLDVGAMLKREWGEFVSTVVRPVRDAGSPPDEGRLIETASRGAEARQLLENPLMLDFLSKQEAALVDRLTRLPLEDDVGRRNLSVAIQTQRQWWHFLAASAREGRVAEAELERLRSGQKAYF